MCEEESPTSSVRSGQDVAIQWLKLRTPRKEFPSPFILPSTPPHLLNTSGTDGIKLVSAHIFRLSLFGAPGGTWPSPINLALLDGVWTNAIWSSASGGVTTSGAVAGMYLRLGLTAAFSLRNGCGPRSAFWCWWHPPLWHQIDGYNKSDSPTMCLSRRSSFAWIIKAKSF